MSNRINGATSVYRDSDGESKRLYNLVTPNGGLRQLCVERSGDISFYAEGPLVSGFNEGDYVYRETDLDQVKTELEPGNVHFTDEGSLRELAWELDEKYMEMR